MHVSPALASSPVAPAAPLRSSSATAATPPSVAARVCGGLWLILAIAVPYVGLAFAGRLGMGIGRARERLDAWSAAAFVSFARRHGALLIKVGQFIATRPDLFAATWIAACGELRDQAPPRPFAEVERSLRAAYGGDIEQRFARIEPTALAAASFGQVHRAVTHDGRVIALKVQYPGLERLVRIDLRLTRLAMRAVRLAMPGFPFADLVGELERASRAELDYLQEAVTAERLRPCLERHGLKVPGIIWEHTRDTVLAMDFAAGTTLGRVDLATMPRERRIALAERVLDAWLGMVLEEGLYHADPHAGNLILGDDGALWLVDFGMTAEISRRQADLYRRFLMHVQARDVDGMLDVMLRLGFVLPECDRDELKRLAQALHDSIGEVAPQALRGSKRPWEIGWAVNEMLLRTRGLVFPQHTVMLARATGMLEGLCAELVPERSFLSLARPLLAERMTPWLRARQLLEEVQELSTALRALPDRLAGLRRERDTGAPAVVAGCALIAATQLPPGATQAVALGAAGVAAVMALRRR